MSYALGIDLGGTKALAGVVDLKHGKVLSAVKKRTRAEHDAKDLITRVCNAANQAIVDSKIDPGEIKHCGVGVAGQIDRQHGVVLAAPNLANMSNVKLAEIIGKEVNLPVQLFNDVEAAAGGEAAHGAGKGKKDFVVVFVGTGIGGSIYRDGKPYKGTTSTAGEIGHIVISVNGRVCGCGGLGHLEAYASRTAIVKALLAGMHTGRKSVLSEVATQINPDDPGGSGIRSGAIARALAADDQLTHETLLVAADYLAAGLASCINFYNPPTLILGGGLIEAVDFFFQTVAARTKQSALRVPRGQVEIVKSGLGDYSGVIGAATLAAE